MPSLADIAEQRVARLRAHRDAEMLAKSIQVTKPFSPHRASRKQDFFLRLVAEEALYGGAAGGGKSDALLHAALQYVDIPGYSAALFRRTKEDLNKPGSILDRARTWFAGTAAKWDGEVHGYRFPSYSSVPGATIHFGYAQTKQEIIDRYQSTEFQYIGVDELTQWIEDAYTYLFSRLRRRTDIPCPTRMRGGTNPGGRGAEWVRRRFVEHARHVPTGLLAREYIKMRNRIMGAQLRGEVSGEELPEPPYFESPPSSEAEQLAKETGRPAQGAFFVPAFREDNPGLNLAEYRANMMRMSATDRAQLEKGDWWATTGGAFFQPEWFPPERILDAAPKLWRRCRYWDLAATKPKKGRDPDWTAGVSGGLHRTETGETQIIITNARRTREDPGGVEAFIRQAAKDDGRQVPIYIEQEPGSAGKNNTHNYATKVLPGWQVHGFPKTGPKAEYWTPLSADAKNAMVYLVNGPWNDEFIAELCGLTKDDSHAHDDYADAAGGLRAVLFDETGLEALRNWRR